MSRSKVLTSITEAIGETPLLALDRLTGDLNGRILAKLEYFSPGHSKKDRIALSIIIRAEAEGRLRPGQTVVEMTSGNTGTGLAIVCRARGYPFVAVMSAGNSAERATMMRAFGAELFLVDQAPGSIPGQVSGDDLKLVEDAAHQLAVARDAFLADQFFNHDNALAHELGTGPEIIRQSDGKIDAYCDFVGTGGSFQGCATALKKHRSNIGCYVVEPSTCPVLAGGPITDLSHAIQGGGYSRSDLVLDRKLIDGFVGVHGDEAIRVTKALACEEGVFGGVSGGANVAAALKLLDGELSGATIVTLIPDSGMKYLSTGLWD